MAEKRRNVKNIIDSLVDDEGLRTEVTITLTDATLLRTGIYLVGTVVASSVAFFMIRGIVKNMEKSVSYD